MEISDSQIIDELKKDSVLGVRLLVEKYQDRLYRWGRWQYETLNDQDLIEIVEDSLLHIINKIDSFELKSEKGFKSWVYTIFSRVCIDHLRKEQRVAKHVKFQSIDDVPSDTGEGESKGSKLDRKIFQDYYNPKPQEHPLAKNVRDFCEGLDENNRTILQGCAMGIPHREIAQWTGIPVKHVKVYYSRLKTKLEKHLKEVC